MGIVVNKECSNIAMNERKSGLENDWKICRDQGVFFKNYKEKGNWKIRIQHFLDFVYYEYRKTR